MRFLIAIWLCAVFVLPASAEENMYMRVVARDNSAWGQTEKYMVRNAALLLGEERVSALEWWLPDVRVERKTWQPDEKTPPAETVYITIGPGEGRNWWGVLYPESAGWAVCPEGEGIEFPFFSWLWALFSCC